MPTTFPPIDRHHLIVPALISVVVPGEEVNRKSFSRFLRAKRLLHLYGICKWILGCALYHADKYNFAADNDIQSNRAAHILNLDLNSQINEIVSLSTDASRSVKCQWVTGDRSKNLYPRSVGRLKLLLNQAVSGAHFTRLESGYESVNPRAYDSGEGNLASAAILVLLCLLISAIFLKYGIWNIYNGSCDWRGVSSIWIGWMPFVVDLSIWPSSI